MAVSGFLRTPEDTLPSSPFSNLFGSVEVGCAAKAWWKRSREILPSWLSSQLASSRKEAELEGTARGLGLGRFSQDSKE